MRPFLMTVFMMAWILPSAQDATANRNRRFLLRGHLQLFTLQHDLSCEVARLSACIGAADEKRHRDRVAPGDASGIVEIEIREIVLQRRGVVCVADRVRRPFFEYEAEHRRRRRYVD